MADWDVIVIGAGAVGLATARALAKAGRSVAALERNDSFGMEISSRNSEVIHAGLYYPTGSLKALACVGGRRALYAYCAAHGVETRKLGKLIVAAEKAELPALEALYQRGVANGVEGLSLLDRAEVRAMEPALDVVAAIHSAESGVFDSHGYMLALLGEIEAMGGALARAAPFEGAAPDPEGWRVRIGGAEPVEMTARVLVNAGGLSAVENARCIEGLEARHIPTLAFSKGSYFQYHGPNPFRRLIYPMPTVGGLGIHLTPDLMGRAKFGPDSEIVPHPDYQVDPARAAHFAADIKRYWPGLDETKLAPDYAGVRPKIDGAERQFRDFRIDGPEVHGLAGLINLFGIDSPGLTSSLALGEMVAARVLVAE
jgi:L-2-hydroxyglutarate oxidase LhgO